jgi:hypothetical protein
MARWLQRAISDGVDGVCIFCVPLLLVYCKGNVMDILLDISSSMDMLLDITLLALFIIVILFAITS